MSDNNFYSTPNTPRDDQATNEPGLVTISLSIVFTLVIAGSLMLPNSWDLGFTFYLAVFMSSFFPALMIVGIFQAGSSFRNSRSRWNIFLWAQLFFMLGELTHGYWLIDGSIFKTSRKG